MDVKGERNIKQPLERRPPLNMRSTFRSAATTVVALEYA